MLRKGLKEIGIVNSDGTDPYNELNPTSIGLSKLHPSYMSARPFVYIMYNNIWLYSHYSIISPKYSR